jgi:hypothetical protein
MTEREPPKQTPFTFNHSKKEEVIVQPLPPVWCSSLCRNSMSEVCVEQCAIKRDCSGFEPKADLNVSNMPRFPLQESAGMTKEERFTAVTIYLAKVVDHLTGVEDDSHSMPVYRRGRVVAEKVQAVAEAVRGIEDPRNTSAPSVTKKENG